MIYGIARREEVEYLKLITIVTAIMAAGRVAGGGDSGEHLGNALKEMRGALFPEIKIDLVAQAEKNVKLLESEFKKGPMKVKAREYSTSRRKKG